VTPIHPDVTAWEAWSPAQIARLLDGLRVPWYVAAGWALDLFAGGQRREHEDLELGVPNTRFDEVADVLRDFEIFVITGPEEATPLAEARDRLFETHQTWIRDAATGRWRFDFFREPSDGDTWICRREPAIRMPYERLIEWTTDGIPYGRPEVVLLLKGKHAHQEKNQCDFATTLPLLDSERRRWLRDALELMHPDHQWLDAL
jgi:Aminoglycoside-2''-adenylyltransferase